jgi:hypothetical protein
MRIGSEFVLGPDTGPIDMHLALDRHRGVDALAPREVEQHDQDVGDFVPHMFVVGRDHFSDLPI